MQVAISFKAQYNFLCLKFFIKAIIPLYILNYYLFIFSCTGTLLLCVDFLQLRQAEATLQLQCEGYLFSMRSSFSYRGAQALACTGFSSCRTQVQELQLKGLVALQHVEPSQTRDRTHVSCIDRQILDHRTTREVLHAYFFALAFFIHYDFEIYLCC